MAAASCQEKTETPRWSDEATRATAEPTKAPSPVAPRAAEDLAQDGKPALELYVKHKKDSEIHLRFVTYNLENWLTMERRGEHSPLKNAPKPDAEKKSVIELLVHHRPDVIGVCEIGTPADLNEVQQLLKKSGLEVPYSHFTGGADPTRHLGLLSRFPITATAKPAKSDYQLDGKSYAINRGILDATITADGKIYRFLGVHLKSKRDVEQADQEIIRQNEATLLRYHVENIFKTERAARLIVYGDFNDTRATPSIKTITSKYGDTDYLTAIPVKDSHGDSWTHYWALQDLYSRIDFVMVSAALKPEVDFHESKILDDLNWNQASDHRAILAIFR